MTKAKAAVRHLYHRGDLHRAILSAALKVLRVTESTEFSLWELGLTLLLVDRHVGPKRKDRRTERKRTTRHARPTGDENSRLTRRRMGRSRDIEGLWPSAYGRLYPSFVRGLYQTVADGNKRENRRERMKLLEFLDVFGFSGICSLAETEGYQSAP